MKKKVQEIEEDGTHCTYKKEIHRACKNFYIAIGAVSTYGLTDDQAKKIDDFYHIAQEICVELEKQ